MNENKKTVVSVKNVIFTYPSLTVPAINNVSFDIYENQYVCIVGHNGSGKSTMSKLLAGLLFPSSGSIHLNGQEVTKKNRRETTKPLGTIFQNPDNQFIGATVRDDIAFGLENRLIETEKMPGIIQEAAKTARVEELLDKSPQDLSGGQKQRVAIAGVLALNVEIILFDEATSMLDPIGKVELKEEMIELKNENKKTVISITHDMNQILDADRIIALNQGKLIFDGTPLQAIENMHLLSETNIDYPFVVKLSNLLKERGIDIGQFSSEKEFIYKVKKLLN